MKVCQNCCPIFDSEINLCVICGCELDNAIENVVDTCKNMKHSPTTIEPTLFLYTIQRSKTICSHLYKKYKLHIMR